VQPIDDEGLVAKRKWIGFGVKERRAAYRVRRKGKQKPS